MPQGSILTEGPGVTDARRRARFNLLTPLGAQFGGQPATVRNISAEGLGLRHAAQVRVSSVVSVRIDAPENDSATLIPCRVVWSRLCPGGENGKLVYDSGLLILDDSSAVAGLLGRLIRAYGVRDEESLETKRRILETRAKARTAAPAPAAPVPSSLPRITPDQVLLIREAQEMIRTNPDAAAKWHARAKDALVETGMIAPGTKSSPYRHDVLVVWAFLGGRLELDLVSLILNLPGA
jgi:hypothetical protein